MYKARPSWLTGGVIEEREETRYDRHAFAQAYVDAHPDNHAAPRGHYDAALKVHRQQLLAGLQDLFDLTLDPEAIPEHHSSVFDVFTGTVGSYLAITAPPTGAVPEAAVKKILDLNQESRNAHLDILAALLDVMLEDRSAKVFTSADLRAIGIDDTPPSTTDYDY